MSFRSKSWCQRPSTCLPREGPHFDQKAAKLYSVGVVHVQHIEGRPPDGGPPCDYRAVPCKVDVPSLNARIEKRSELSAARVKSSNVFPFVIIAMRAREREVSVGRFASMLLGDDVIDGERELGDVGWNLAILATVFGLRPDFPIQSFIHHLRFLPGFFQGENGPGLQDRQHVIYLDKRFELLRLLDGDLTSLLFREKLEQSLLILLTDAQIKDEPRPSGGTSPPFISRARLRMTALVFLEASSLGSMGVCS